MEFQEKLSLTAEVPRADQHHQSTAAAAASTIVQGSGALAGGLVGPVELLRTIRPSVRGALQHAGYTRCEQLHFPSVSPVQLAANAHIALEDAAAVIEEITASGLSVLAAAAARSTGRSRLAGLKRARQEEAEGGERRTQEGTTTRPDAQKGEEGAPPTDEEGEDPTGASVEAAAPGAIPRGLAVLVAGRSAYDLWRADQALREAQSVCIPTFCRELDDLLGGGVALGSLTELCGPPGVGKTQMSIQLAVAVQLPPAFGGPCGKCLYVDTEGSFVAGRFREVAAAAVAQVQHIAHQQQHETSPEELADLRRGVERFTVQQILDSTVYYRVHQLVDVVALVHALPAMMASDPDIKLVLFDSIAFHFRSIVGGDYSLRSRLLFLTAQHLQRTCREFGIAVVCTNQMTTRMAENSGAAAGGAVDVVPALGDAWAHGVSTRLVLSVPPPSSVPAAPQQRRACLEKSPSRPRGECAFRITGKGIRGIAPPTVAEAG